MNYSGSSGIHIPKLSKVNKILIITCTASFLIGSILKLVMGISLAGILGLSGITFFGGMIFTPFTYFLVQPDIFNLLFNCLVLWFFGSDLENKWGAQFYLWFLITAVLGGAFTYLLFSKLFFANTATFFIPFVGIQGICFGVLLAYGIIYSEALIPFMLIFPIKAKYFCMIIVAIEIYSGIFAEFGKSSWGHLGAMSFAYLYLWWKSNTYEKYKAKFNVFYQKKNSEKRHLHIVNEDSDKDKKPRYWQ